MPQDPLVPTCEGAKILDLPQNLNKLHFFLTSKISNSECLIKLDTLTYIVLSLHKNKIEVHL